MTTKTTAIPRKTQANIRAMSRLLSASDLLTHFDLGGIPEEARELIREAKKKIHEAAEVVEDKLIADGAVEL